MGSGGEVGDGGEGDGDGSWAVTPPLATSCCPQVEQGVTDRVAQGQDHQQQPDAPVRLLVVQVLEARWL